MTGPEKVDRLVVYVLYEGDTDECHVHWDDWDRTVVIELLRRAAQGLEELEQSEGKRSVPQEPG